MYRSKSPHYKIDLYFGQNLNMNILRYTKEILIVLPADNINNMSKLMLKFKSLNLKLLISKKKIKYIKE